MFLGESKVKKLTGNINCIDNAPVDNLGNFSELCEFIVFRICHSCRIQKLRERYKNENEQIPDRYMDVSDAVSVRVRCAKKLCILLVQCLSIICIYLHWLPLLVLIKI